MDEDDFVPVEQRVAEIADGLIAALLAQGMAARSGETAQQAQPEGQQPGPKDAPNG